jgi:hypothetical protein
MTTIVPELLESRLLKEIFLKTKTLSIDSWINFTEFETVELMINTIVSA